MIIFLLSTYLIYITSLCSIYTANILINQTDCIYRYLYCYIGVTDFGFPISEYITINLFLRICPHN
jgi:hypothetical protein